MPFSALREPRDEAKPIRAPSFAEYVNTLCEQAPKDRAGPALCRRTHNNPLHPSSVLSLCQASRPNKTSLTYVYNALCLMLSMYYSCPGGLFSTGFSSTDFSSAGFSSACFPSAGLSFRASSTAALFNIGTSFDLGSAT